MKQKIKTINNKRLVKGDNPNELGKDELLVEVDNTTGKISLFEKDSTGKVNQVAGSGSDDGPLPGALELGLEDCFYYAIGDHDKILPNMTKVSLEGVEDGELVVLDDLQIFDPCTIGACLTEDVPADIALKCYIKHYDAVNQKPNFEAGPKSASSIGLVFSAETSLTPCSFLEIRTPIKKHLINIHNGSNVMLLNATNAVFIK